MNTFTSVNTLYSRMSIVQDFGFMVVSQATINRWFYCGSNTYNVILFSEHKTVKENGTGNYKYSSLFLDS